MGNCAPKITLKGVASSTISAVGARQNFLYVMFQNSPVVYRFTSEVVSMDAIHAGMLKAPSVGSYFHHQVKMNKLITFDTLPISGFTVVP